jgi:membrane-bound lytic murein transglycosylase D
MIYILLILFSSQVYASDISRYLSDPDNKVANDFSIPSQLYPRVKFWFDIYTKYDSKIAVIHDTDNLSIVYSAIDTANVTNKLLNRHTKYALIKKYRKQYLNHYKDALRKLSKGRCQQLYCKKVLESLSNAKIKIPRNTRKRKLLFSMLRSNIRIQTGQSDKIKKGLQNINRYGTPIERIFDAHKLPKELLAIALLESSFNVNAKSKVNATGPWQFMNYIGKHFMNIDRYQDQRKNAFLSTSAALHLLRQNKQILKHWDLAINAYNSGTNNIRKGIKYLKKRKGIKTPRVHHIVKYYNSKAYQFAGKNFYSEFLALAHIISYRNKIYPEEKIFNGNSLHAYITKCSLNLNKLLKSIRSSDFKMNIINNHLNKRIRKFPKGTIVFSDVPLTKRRFHKVGFKDFKKYYPNKMYKKARSYKCSTK